MPYHYRCLYLACLLSSFSYVSALFAQSPVEVEHEVISVAYIFEPKLIRTLIETNLIPIDPDSVEKIRFIDLTNNGFGNEDMMTLFPSRMSFPFLVDSALANGMESWTFNTGEQVIARDTSALFYEQLAEKEPKRKAVNGILAGILRALNSNFHGETIKIYFERTATHNIRLDMWGFTDSTDIFYGQNPETWNTNPLSRIDTVIVVKRDTVYVPVDGVRVSRKITE